MNSKPDVLLSTPIQAAYVVGAGAEQPLGGQHCLGYVEFSGRLSPHEVRDALPVLHRHPSLHCVVPDASRLCLAELKPPALSVNDLRSRLDVEAELNSVRERLTEHDFDLAAGDTWSVELSLLPDGTSRLHLLVSLVVTDLAGIARMAADLACALTGQSLQTHTLDELRDAIKPQRRNVELAAPDERRVPLLPAPELPSGPHIQDGTDRYERLIPAERWALLDAAANRLGVSTTALALGVFEETLRRWSTNDEFIVTVTGVDIRGSEDHVADRTRTFAHRSIPADSLEALAVEAADELRYRLMRGVEATEELREGLMAGEHAGLSPYVFTFAPKSELFTRPVLDVLGDVAKVRSSTPQVIIDCQVIRLTDQGVTVSFDVRRGALIPAVAVAVFEAFVASLELLIDAEWEGSPLPELTQLAPLEGDLSSERARVNSTPSLGRHTLHGAFFDLARKHPDQVALLWDPTDHPTWPAGSMTYGELSEHARTLASQIAEKAAAGSVVGIRLPKGPQQVIAVLATLVAGCCYLPLGVDQPQDRVDAIREASDMALLIDETFLDGVMQMPHAGRIEDDRAAVDDVAYIIYTSGSTGAPKGVVIRHEAAANTVLDINQRNEIGRNDRTLAVSALDFDLSVYDIFGPLSAGGAVVLISEDSRRDAFRWAQLVETYEVTVWNTVPSLAEMVHVAAERPLGLRRVMCSGDWIDMGLPERLAHSAPEAVLVAMGGATEAAIWSNEFVVSSPSDLAEEWQSIPYGVPLSGQRYRVAATDGRDCPDYVPGELWIGGAGLADGYHGAPDLTADRFVDVDGERWYRTGDLGMWVPGPLLVFLGRNDTQVKVRGHRIECGEVEHALRALDAVREAVVVPIRRRTALGAVIVPAGEVQPHDLETRLAAKLPHYMVPASFSLQERMQLTPNGKVDRRWAATLLEGQSQSDLGRANGAVAQAWSRILERGSVQLQDNFFSLGGDSLLATKLCAQLRVEGYDVSVADVFAAPRLADFADVCQTRRIQRKDHQAGPVHGDSVAIQEPQGRFPLTPLQRAYALGSDGMRGVVQAPTMFAAILGSSDGSDIDIARLQAVASVLVAELEGLRCQRIDDVEQDVQSAQPVQVREVSDPLEVALEAEPMPSGVVVELMRGSRPDRVGIRLDYLSLDARSILTIITCLVDDFRGVDRRLRVGSTITPFRRYAADKVASEAGDVGQADGVLAPAPNLPHQPNKAATQAGAQGFRLSHREVSELERAAHQAGVTVSAMILHAFGAALECQTGQTRMGVTVPTSSRPGGLEKETLGNFTELALCEVGSQVSLAQVHAELGRAVSQESPGERHIAGAGRAAYPVVFTSTIGLTDASMQAVGGRTGIDVVWSRTSTPGVLVDCQVEARDDGIEVRFDYPRCVLSDELAGKLLRTMQDQLVSGGDNAHLEASAPRAENICAEELLGAALERLDATGADVQEHLAAVVAIWRTECRAAPRGVYEEDAQTLVDCLVGRTRITGLLEHPRLSPQALLLAQPGFDDVLRPLVETLRGLPAGARVVEIGSGAGLFREAVLTRTDRPDLTWISVEPDSLLRDVALSRGVTTTPNYRGSADLVVACTSLHRDSRLAAAFEGVEAHRCWVAEVPEVTPVSLVSAALLDPSIVEPETPLKGLPHWWSWLERSGWRPTAADARFRGLVVIEGKAAALDASVNPPARPVTPPVDAQAGESSTSSHEADVLIPLLADSWKRHLRTPEIHESDDFFTLGGDSLAATHVLADLRAAGYEVRLVELFNHPRLDELAQHVAQLSSAAKPGSAPVVAPASQDSSPAVTHYPLTLVQQAYLAGRGSQQLLGGVSAHCYYEFTVADFDAEAFTRCVHDVALRHPALRTTIHDSSEQGQAPTARVHDELFPQVIQHADPRGATQGEVVDLTSTAPMVVRWCPLPDGRALVGVGLENILLDGASMALVLKEIGDRYAGVVPLGLPGPQTSFGSYVAARPWLTAMDPAEVADAKVSEDQDYWTQISQDLAPAPQLAERTDLAALTGPSFARATATVPADAWQRATRLAAEKAVTPASLVLAAYCAALARLTGQSRLTVNVTRFDRDADVPGIAEVVGDFTTLVPVTCAVDSPENPDVMALAVDLRDQLAEAAEHDRAGTLWVQRKMLQRTGDPAAALLPVVYTCGLGLENLSDNLEDFGFGPMTYAASQTPQTVFDLQVSADARGMHLSADYVTQLVLDGDAEGALHSIRESLEALDHGRVRQQETGNSSVISTIWADVLGLESVDERHNFFTAGGDSLRATQCVRQLREKVHPDIDLRLLLTNPDFTTFSAAVERLPDGAAPSSSATTETEEGTL